MKSALFVFVRFVRMSVDVLTQSRQAKKYTAHYHIDGKYDIRQPHSIHCVHAHRCDYANVFGSDATLAIILRCCGSDGEESNRWKC